MLIESAGAVDILELYQRGIISTTTLIVIRIKKEPSRCYTAIARNYTGVIRHPLQKRISSYSQLTPITATAENEAKGFWIRTLAMPVETESELNSHRTPR